MILVILSRHVQFKKIAYNQRTEVNGMNDKEYDFSLKIKTTGVREWLTKSTHHNRYEATPYEALDEFFSDYKLEKENVLVDFGCGKGRLPFYIHNRFDVATTGVEVSELLYDEALKNLVRYMDKRKKSAQPIRFECTLAEKYDIKETDTHFYFFNPFSTVIFAKVIDNILLSTEKYPREVDVILYYPTAAYMHFMEDSSPFELFQEVKLTGLNEINKNERFVVFRYLGSER